MVRSGIWLAALLADPLKTVMAIDKGWEMLDIQLLSPTRCTLGEGILWDEQQEKLWWVDIQQCRLWSHHPSSGQEQYWILPQRVCSLAMTTSPGVLILGLAKQLVRFDSRNGALTLLAEVEAEHPATRINDGRTDRAGNFVFGTMNEHGPEAIGRFYRFTTSGQLQHLALPAVTVANSIAFSPDGKTLYCCDTPTRRILKGNYDADSGAVDQLRVFAELDQASGYPDGSAVDAAGCLWNAEWGGKGITCYTPDGQVRQRVALPVTQATCLTFAGPQLDTLYVTSAHIGLSGPQRTNEASAGAVLQLTLPGLRGLPEARYCATDASP